MGRHLGLDWHASHIPSFDVKLWWHTIKFHPDDVAVNMTIQILSPANQYLSRPSWYMVSCSNITVVLSELVTKISEYCRNRSPRFQSIVGIGHQDFRLRDIWFYHGWCWTCLQWQYLRERKIQDIPHYSRLPSKDADLSGSILFAFSNNVAQIIKTHHVNWLYAT